MRGPIRLWYQSLTRTATWPAYNQALRAVLDAAKDEGTSIEVHGIEKRGGIGDQYRYLEFIEAQEVLQNVERASREGFDAFLIGNSADPGLREAREATDLPVLGLLETSVHLASMMGGNFCIVTGNGKAAPKIVENIGRYGFAGKLSAVRAMKVERLMDLDQAFVDPAVGGRMADEFLATASASVAEGAEVVIPAAGVVTTLLARHGIHAAAPGVPILHTVTALVKMGEAAVRMRRLCGGHWTSRRALYAAPPPEQIEELRKVYGPVYPWVKKP